MTKLLLRFRPLGSFAFGGEGGLNDPGSAFFADFSTRQTELARRRQSYCATSQPVPQQSTLLGAIRKLVLVNHGKLRTKGYTPAEWAENAELIGSHSLNLENPLGDGWGKISSLSPVFLVGGATFYLPCPFDCQSKPEELVQPIDMPDADGTLAGIDYKAGHFVGWMGYDMTTGERGDRCKNDAVFTSADHVGIRKREQHAADEQGFYIRQRHRFARGEEKRRNADAFGVLVETELGADKLCGMVTLGADRCLFEVSAAEALFSLEKCRPYEKANDPKSHRIALISPAKLWDGWRNEKGLTAAIVDTLPARTLRTERNEKANGKHRVVLSSTRLTLAQAGSVFFFSGESERDAFAANLRNPGLQLAGYNHFVTYACER